MSEHIRGFVVKRAIQIDAYFTLLHSLTVLVEVVCRTYCSGILPYCVITV